MLSSVAALPNAPRVLRVACSGTSGGGEVWLTRFFVQYQASAPTPANVVTFCNGVITSWSTHLSSVLTPNKTLTAVETTDLTSPTNSQALVDTDNPGTRTGAWLPPAVCAVASYQVDRRYRGGHPRGYFPSGSETDIDTNGQWDPLFVTDHTLAVRNFFTDVLAINWGTSEGLQHVNVSYYQGFTVVIDPVTGRARNVPKLRSGGPSIDTVVGVSTRPIIGTQRRRGQF
jgi:hypothetical protein